MVSLTFAVFFAGMLDRANEGPAHFSVGPSERYVLNPLVMDTDILIVSCSWFGFWRFGSEEQPVNRGLEGIPHFGQ